ncbi:MAG: Gfo/Idh/MocA family protein [Candidatus Zipacnadales bacterium]
MGPDHTLDRSEFMKLSASTALGAAALSSGAGRAQNTQPIRVGFIGCGGMGNAHLGTLMRLREAGEPVELVAVCDVYQVRLDAAAQLTGADKYANYQDVIAREDIDVIGIATPDHWHAPITLAALKAGKDVYCEKPMTYWRHLEEPQAIVKAVAENDRVMQVGTQGMADDIYDLVGARIREGAIGGLVHAQASDMRNGPIAVYSPQTNDGRARPGENLDWEMWLGPAPKREWEPGRFFAFRSFWDYSGGVGTDFFPHILTPLVYTMDLKFPHRVTASGGLYQWHDGREVPDIFTMVIEYPGGPSILLTASLSNDSGLPMMIRGKNATMHFEGPGAIIRPQGSAGDAVHYEELARTKGLSLDEHWRDLLRCVRTREKPRSNELLGYYVMTALHMGLRSYHEGKTFEFDAETETVKPVG